MLLVELEQFHHVNKVIDSVLEAFIHKNVNVELLVAPVDLKDWLEALQEVLSLLVSVVDDSVNALFL